MSLNMTKILYSVSKYNTTQKIYLKLVLSIIIVFLISTIHYIFFNSQEHWYNLQNNQKISFMDFICYTFTCWFTLGYGDIVPKSTIVKFLSVIIMFLAYVIILL